MGQTLNRGKHVWRTDLDFMVTHSDRLVVLSFMTSSPTYPNVTTARPPMSELERKLYRNGYFEQSDLVEKFSDYDDDIATLDTSDEAFRTHEALEMGTQLFGGSSSIAISTMENFNVPGGGENPTTLHTLPPVRNLITTTTTTTTAPRLKQSVSTQSTVPNTSLERSSSRESRRRDSN
uniref:Uncharacterized protein n=1 Tax=Anopheles maculatus TaxID=74869 RepID=A0A182TBB7_9DIPT